MIFDNTTLLSDQQAITTSAASSNVIDATPVIGLGLTRDIGAGAKIPLAIQVTEQFTADGAGTLTVALQVSDAENFGSFETIAVSPTYGKAALKPGLMIGLEAIARGANKRYARLYYTVATGPMTAGKIVAGVTLGVYTNG